MNAPGGPEDAEALALYQRLWRAACSGTLLVIALSAAAVAVWNVWYALCLLAGGAAGIVNAWLSMKANERLLDRRSVGTFVISSFVRIALFGIVPVILAVRRPSVWTLGWYFIGFFTPLVLSGIVAILRERSG